MVPQKYMDAIIERFSDKVNMRTFLNSEPSRLSGGQKQRVAIAGILAMSPDIIIFDKQLVCDPKGKEDKNISMQLHKEVR